MSARKFPRDVPRSVQAAVRAALELIDAAGEVVGGMRALQEALGHDTARATRAVIEAAEALGYMRRVGPIGHGERRVFVVVARLKSSAVCETTGCEKPAAGRWCPSCRQVNRADRAWWARAVQMLVDGASPSEIAQTLKQPLFPDGEDRGVVATLIAEVPHLVTPAWREALTAHSPGLNVSGGSRGALTHRQRVRRARRRQAQESSA
jgi:hypothetical protein